MAVLALLVEPKLLLVVGLVVLDLDVAIVLDAPRDSRSDGRGALDLAEAVGGRECVRQRHEQVVDVRRAAERASWAGLLGERDLQAVEMPEEAAVRARDDGAVWGRGGAVALVAEDGLALGVFQTEIVGSLFVADAIPRYISIDTTNRRMNKLTLAWEEHPRHTLPQGRS